jgi:hypothetical protein
MSIPSLSTQSTGGSDSAGQSRLSPNLAFVFYYAFKILPFLVTALSIYLGYRLFILGVTGKASLSFASDTLKGQRLDATPGLFFAVGGIVLTVVAVWKGVQVDFDGHPRMNGYMKKPPGTIGRHDRTTQRTA